MEHYETIRRRKDGRPVDISVTVSPICEPGGKVIGASKVARMITERKRLQKEILEISEREQRRIGNDLHDGLCQELAGVELMCQVVEQKFAPQSKSSPPRWGKSRSISAGHKNGEAMARPVAGGAGGQRPHVGPA